MTSIHRENLSIIVSMFMVRIVFYCSIPQLFYSLNCIIDCLSRRYARREEGILRMNNVGLCNRMMRGEDVYGHYWRPHRGLLYSRDQSTTGGNGTEIAAHTDKIHLS